MRTADVSRAARARSSRASISTVPRVPPASFCRHSPSVSKRWSPISSPHGAIARRDRVRVERVVARGADRAAARRARRARKARSAIAVLMLYFRPTHARGKTRAICLK